MSFINYFLFTNLDEKNGLNMTSSKLVGLAMIQLILRGEKNRVVLI